MSANVNQNQVELKKDVVSAVPYQEYNKGKLGIKLSLEEAINESVLQNSKLFHTWGHPRSKLIGKLCQIFKEDEMRWTSARILNYILDGDLYFVWYMKSGKCNWIPYNETAFLIAEDNAVANMTKSTTVGWWPALLFSINDFSKKFVMSMKGYKENHKYIEFFGESDVDREYYFLKPEKINADVNFAWKPAKISKKLQSAILSSQIEKDMKDVIVKKIAERLSETSRAGTTGDSHGLFLSFRVSVRSTSLSQNLFPAELGHATLVRYYPNTKKYLAVFDSKTVKPLWLHIGDTMMDNKVMITMKVFLGNPGEEQQRQTMNYQSWSDIYRQWKKSKDINISIAASGENTQNLYSTCNCALCGNDDSNTTSSSNIQDNLLSESTGITSPLLLEDQKQKQKQTISFQNNLVTCLQCNINVHEGCIPVPTLNTLSSLTSSKKSSTVTLNNWNCWSCNGCECCDSSSWDRDIITTNLQSFYLKSTTKKMSRLCALCIERYKKQEFCPMCMKLYYDDRTSKSYEFVVASEGVTHYDMIQCYDCSYWIHAECEGMSKDTYERVSLGKHPLWGAEYMCPKCRLELPSKILREVQFEEDPYNIFAEPVSQAIAPNYYDIVKHPINLNYMKRKADKGLYFSKQSIRSDIELLCYNALHFNKVNDVFWTAAKDFYEKVIHKRLVAFFASTYPSFYGIHINLKLHKLLNPESVSKSKQKLRLAAPTAAVVLPPSSSSSIVNLTTDSEDLYSKSNLYSDRSRSRAMKRKSIGEIESAASDVSLLCQEVKSSDSAGNVIDMNAVRMNFGRSSTFNDTASLLTSNAVNSLPETLASSTVESNVDSTYHAVEATFLLSSFDVPHNINLPTCLYCGSSGSSDHLLRCSCCCENFHSFCCSNGTLEGDVGSHVVPLLDMTMTQKESWQCSDCKQCNICHQKLFDTKRTTHPPSQIICSRCDVGFHIDCLSPLLSDTPEGFQIINDTVLSEIHWFCPQCVNCQVHHPIIVDNLSSEALTEMSSIPMMTDSLSTTSYWGVHFGECILCTREKVRELVVNGGGCSLCELPCLNAIATTGMALNSTSVIRPNNVDVRVTDIQMKTEKIELNQSTSDNTLRLICGQCLGFIKESKDSIHSTDYNVEVQTSDHFIAADADPTPNLTNVNDMSKLDALVAVMSTFSDTEEFLGSESFTDGRSIITQENKKTSSENVLSSYITSNIDDHVEGGGRDGSGGNVYNNIPTPTTENSCEIEVDPDIDINTPVVEEKEAVTENIDDDNEDVTVGTRSSDFSYRKKRRISSLFESIRTDAIAIQPAVVKEKGNSEQDCTPCTADTSRTNDVNISEISKISFYTVRARKQMQHTLSVITSTNSELLPVDKSVVMAPSDTTVDWEDSRYCILCRGADSDSDATEGRLIPFSLGIQRSEGEVAQQGYLHVNCARWSTGVEEKKGRLTSVLKAFWRSQRRKCFVCKQFGGTLICAAVKCRRIFHLRCALLLGCQLTEVKSTSEDTSANFDILTYTTCPSHQDYLLKAMNILPLPWQPSDPLRPLMVTSVSDHRGRAPFNALKKRNISDTALDIASEVIKDYLLESEKINNKIFNKMIPTVISTDITVTSHISIRCGAIIIYDLGTLNDNQNSKYFRKMLIWNQNNILIPLGFRSVRTFWSTVTPRQSTTYIFEVCQ